MRLLTKVRQRIARWRLSLTGLHWRRRLRRLQLRALRQLQNRSQAFPTSFDKLRRVTPISREWGFDRGQPIDRYYIENFLARQAADIQGHVLEVGDDSYTRKYGSSHVETSDVLDVVQDNPRATIVADLSRAEHVPSNTFDCIICTQTLQLIYEVRSAVHTLHRILKPGGVLLLAVPGTTQIGEDENTDNWCWAFTTVSVRRLFEERFPLQNLTVEAYGNVLAAISFLHGLATEELRQEELDYRDPNYPFLITLRAVKSEGAP